MRKLSPARRLDARGLSLVELLIALAISGLVATAAYSVFHSSGTAARTSENITAVQMNLRAAMDIISRDIRQAGFGLEETPAPLAFSGGTFSSPVTFGNSSTGPDWVRLLGVGHLAGYLERVNDADHSGVNDCNEPGDDTICLDTVGEFLNTSNVYQPDRRYISIAGAFFMELDADPSAQDKLGTKTLKIAAGSNRVNGDYKNADRIPVYILQAIEYSISTTNEGCSAISPCLVAKDYSGVRGGGAAQVIAQHIEDLQLAYGIDANPRDRRVDYPASGYTEADFMSAPVADPKSIIAVRVNLVGKTPVTDSTTRSVRPAVEDRAAGATADGYRRRVQTKVIKIRNPRS